MKLAKLILLLVFLSFLSGNLGATASFTTQTNRAAEGNFVSEIHLETDTNSLLAGLNDDSNGLLNICLPNISYDNYNNRVFGFYDYYGRGGFLSAVVNDNGTLSYVYSGPFGENGAIVYLQFNKSTGQWDSFNKPSPNCLSCDLNSLFAALWSNDVGHFILDVAGMTPVVGEAFDALNGVWYLIERDGVNASLSFASTIPLVYATTIKNVGRVIKLQDGTFAAIKLSSKATETLIATLKNLNLSDDALKRLFKDLQNTDFAKALSKKPELVEAWKKMDQLGVDKVLRRNPGALDALSKPKGTRPDPSTYLDADYIANHLAKFDDGSSRIVLKDSYLRRGVGKPDAGKTEFVFPKSEMDEILSLPNAEKAKKLGIPESQLDGELVRIDFKSTDKIEMPSGNEFGANDQWIPGGKTDGGVSEAIVKTEGMQLDIDYTVTDL